MGYRLKQENFNKPVTAEALKVIRLLSLYSEGGYPAVPSVSVDLTVHPETPLVHNSVYGYRCHRITCYCSITRLQANIVIRYLLATYPEKRIALRQWREQRKLERARRRRLRGMILERMTPEQEATRGIVGIQHAQSTTEIVTPFHERTVI